MMDAEDVQPLKNEVAELEGKHYKLSRTREQSWMPKLHCWLLHIQNWIVNKPTRNMPGKKWTKGQCVGMGTGAKSLARNRVLVVEKWKCLRNSLKRRQRCCVSQATSHGQVVRGTGVSFNIASPILQSLSMLPNLANAARLSQNTSKSFTLKLKTKQIKVCQSCRKDYEGENDTLGLVVAHPERRLISNPITGTQFLGKESNSHYHAHMKCLKIVDSTFSGDNLVIPQDLVPKLTVCQKVYLNTCLQVPVEINLMAM